MGGNMKVLFLANCIYHKKFEDRYVAMLKEGWSITVVGLDWFHGRSQPCAEIDYSNFHKIPRQTVLPWYGRLMIWARLVLKLLVLRFNNLKYDLVLVNSFEMFLCGEIFFGSSTRKIFDLADVHPLQVDKGYLSRVLNFIELYFSKNNWEYVVTSPWFYWDFLIKRVGYSGRCYLIENCISYSNLTSYVQGVKNQTGKVNILWNGILRCERSAHLILNLIGSSNGRIKLVIAGDFSLLSSDVRNKLLSNDSVSIYGSYSDDSILDIYNGIDMVWISDLAMELNAKMLLPNRLYQAVYFMKPSISIGDTAMTKVVQFFGIGLAFYEDHDFPVESYCEKILGYDPVSALENLAGLRSRAIRRNEWSEVFSQKAISLPRHEDVSVVFDSASSGNP